MKWLKHCVIIATAMFFSLGESSARSLSARDISKVDSSYATGMAYLETGEHRMQNGGFARRWRSTRKHAPSYVGLGHVYLKRGEI